MNTTRQEPPQQKELGYPYLMNSAILALLASLAAASVLIPGEVGHSAHDLQISGGGWIEQPNVRPGFFEGILRGCINCDATPGDVVRGGWQAVRYFLDAGRTRSGEDYRLMDLVFVVILASVAWPYLPAVLASPVRVVQVLSYEARHERRSPVTDALPYWWVALLPGALIAVETGLIRLPIAVSLYLAWLCVLSVFSFAEYAVDKRAAIHNGLVVARERQAEQRAIARQHARDCGRDEESDVSYRDAGFEKARVPEVRLNGLALVGGWPGSLVAQAMFRHKTSVAKRNFVRDFRFLVVLHCLPITFAAIYLTQFARTTGGQLP